MPLKSVKEMVIRNLSELKPADYNPRELSVEQHDQIKKSIQEFGLVDPLIINQHPDRKDVIVGGHQRHRVATELGYVDAPCVYVNLPLDKERELNVRLNKNTGGWNWDSLANEFDIAELKSFGFTEQELGLGFDDGTEPGEDGPKEPKLHECPACGFKFQ